MGNRDTDDTTFRIMRSSGHVATLVIRKSKLVVVQGPDKGKEYILDPNTNRIRIGTHRDNNLVLTDDTVSRHHAEVVQHEGGNLVRDLGSTNGTFINDLSVKEAFLNLDATLRMGTTVLRLTPIEDRWKIKPKAGARLGNLIGKSQKMREVFGLLQKVAKTDLTIILTGETGTGKELAARVIHGLSSRASHPFVVVDCGAIAQELIESELFGHEKGAFTGAITTRKGSFEQAQGGTLFLDEIGELSLEMQPKLLRVLEQREVRRVGGNQILPIDVRVIAATHRDLPKEVKEGNFRQDLYYRLSVVPIPLPPLRDRVEDIPQLIDHFLKAFPQSRTKSAQEIPPETLSALLGHPWPGNVRELRNIVERAASLGEGFHLTPPRSSKPLQPPPPEPVPTTQGGSLEAVEKAAIEQTLRETMGNKKAAAKILGIATSTLYEKIKKYKIKPSAWRPG